MHIINLKDDPDQLQLLALWHQQEWSALNPGETIEGRIARMQLYLNNELLPSMFIARNEQLLGSAALVAHDMDSRTDLSPWLASVFVAAEHRCRGIGATLVKHVMRQAFIGGIERLYLYTADKQDFYFKLGWKILGHETYHGIDVTIMHINLRKLFNSKKSNL